MILRQPGSRNGTGRWNRWSRMRVGFSLWPFSTPWGGIVYYALNLLSALAQLDLEDLVVFYPREGSTLLRDVKRMSLVPVSGIEEVLSHARRFDLLFAPCTSVYVPQRSHPTVRFIPDVQEQYYPHFFAANDLSDRARSRPHLLNSSTLVITCSHYSKRTIGEMYQVREDRLRVVHHSPHPVFFEDRREEARLARLPAEMKNYLLYPANSWRHKNHIGLLNAVVELRDRDGIQVPVVLTGDLLSGQHNHVDISSEIRARGLQDQVCHLGRVSLRELKNLYVNALALVYPSLFEGFGLPLVEAMACGTPILASDRTSIPEIAGNAALYFDPENVSEMTEAIRLHVEDPEGSRKRVRIGKARASLFRPKRQAEEHILVFEEALTLAPAKDANLGTGNGNGFRKRSLGLV